MSKHSKKETLPRKGSGNRLVHGKNNKVDFSLDIINELIKKYKNVIVSYSLVNENTIQVQSKLMNTWFIINEGSFILLKHRSKGESSIKLHTQSEHYTLDHAFYSIGTHDCYKANKCSDYRSSRIGKLFSLVEKGQTKHIKIN
jgi:hypothetical protein